MKTNVEIWDASIMTSDSFESKIAKLINDELDSYGYENVKIIELEHVSMRWTGYGQYSISVELTIDKLQLVIAKHSTDSQLYDRINSDDIADRTLSNELKRMALTVLEFQIENLVDDLIDTEIVKKLEVTQSN